jgi:hypothetical protein
VISLDNDPELLIIVFLLLLLFSLAIFIFLLSLPYTLTLKWPNFDLTLPSSKMLEKIGFHLDQYEMILECEDKEKLSLIYAKLKMIISHKGFNEYFKPIKRLGKGAFATVYLIEHKMTK